MKKKIYIVLGFIAVIILLADAVAIFHFDISSVLAIRFPWQSVKKPTFVYSKMAGCGNFDVYKINDNKTELIGVYVDEKKLKIENGKKYPLEKEGAISVQVSLGKDLANCTDLMSYERHTDDVWTAVSGSITIVEAPLVPTPTVIQELPSRKLLQQVTPVARTYPLGTHTVTVQLENVIFTNTYTKERRFLQKMNFENVWVGFYAG